MDHDEKEDKLYIELAERIITSKTFQFADINFSLADKDALSAILKYEGDQVTVEPDERLIIRIVSKMKLVLNYSPVIGLNGGFDFFLEMCYYFRQDQSTIRRLKVFERRILHYMLCNMESHDYAELPQLLESQRQLYSEILPAFAQSLDRLSFGAHELFKVSESFWSHSPANFNKTYLWNGLIPKIVGVLGSNLILAEEYMDLSLAADLYRSEQISVAIAGIISTGNTDSKKIDQLLLNEEYHKAIAKGILLVNIEDREQVCYLYDLAEMIFETNNEVKQDLARFYQRIADSEIIADNKLKELCLRQIEQLCASEDPELIKIGLSGLADLGTIFTPVIFSIIGNLSILYRDRQILFSCLEVFNNHPNVDEFFTFVTKCALHAGTAFPAGDFTNAISLFYDEDKEGLSRGLINLLIDDRGLVRFAGTSLLVQILNTFDNSFRFSIDLTQLPSLDQYKVWVSLLDDDARVMDFLPITLPILNSQNWFVAESLMARIEEEIKNYGSTIYSILEKNLIDENPKKADALSRVKTTMDVEFAKNDDKLKIKELDPRYTQSTLLNKYYEIFKKRTSEELEEQVDKKSIFRQLATTINLAKGGGWLNKDTGKVMELKKVAYEKQLPAKYFSDPENIDAERINKILQSNWSEEFKECEAIISLYENTLNP